MDKINKLAENEKPYYGTGFYAHKYDNFKHFYEDMKGFDVDLNLVYRFDISEHEDERGSYYLQAFIIMQRKGKVVEHYIEDFKQEDVELLRKYLEPHQAVCRKLINF